MNAITALADKSCTSNELAAIRLQEAELQAQQDAFFAERLAVALSLGVVVEDGQTLDTILQACGCDFPHTTDSYQLERQLQELRAMADRLVAELTQGEIAEQEQKVTESEKRAAVLQEYERMQSHIMSHDAAFARKIAAVDEKLWQEIGDDIADPLDVPVFADELETPALQPPCGKEPSDPGCSAAGPRPSNKSDEPSSAPGPSSRSCRLEPSSCPAQAPTSGTIECLSCFDRFPEQEVICAGSDAASSSTGAAGCGHFFCSRCVTEYVRIRVGERKYPIGCPMAAAAGAGGRAEQQQGCRLNFSKDAVLAALQRHPKELQVYRLLEAESALDPSQVVYCPHKACSNPLLLEQGGMPPNKPTNCPACHKVFCPHCRIPGWHKGYTCAQFQALPAHLRSAEDAAVLQLSVKKHWKQCPQCQQMVERSEGCNHVLCRCGSNFCYNCGKLYKNTKSTAGNVHGTPTCRCLLFNVPAEVERESSDDEHDVGGDNRGARGGAAAAGPAGQLPMPGNDDNMDVHLQMRPRPWRNGRLVSRSRCLHSDSIFHCPQGPERCWFWHDEDDDGLFLDLA